MSAVADALRDEVRERVARLSGAERVVLALRLGERDVELYARARCVDRKTAAAVLARARRIGRTLSRCVEHESD